jgi:hypothetical protein
MNKIILTEELENEIEIYEDLKRKTYFTIYLKTSNKALINSIKSVLKNYTQIGNKLNIRAKNIIAYSSSSSLDMNYMFFLISQIRYLITEERKCFYKIDERNVLMIDNKLLYISTDHLKEMDSKRNIKINTIIENKRGFLSPEVLNMSEIPSKISYKVIYYSIGLFILDILGKKDIKVEEIRESKLYYLIDRCLKEDINSRFLLYL